MNFHVGTFQVHKHFWPNLNSPLEHLMAQITQSIYSAGDLNWRISLDKIVIHCSGIS